MEASRPLLPPDERAAHIDTKTLSDMYLQLENYGRNMQIDETHT